MCAGAAVAADIRLVVPLPRSTHCRPPSSPTCAQVLLPQLHELVYEVRSKGLGSAQLWSLLHGRAHCGVPMVESVTQRLLWHCNQVLFKQLASWWVAVWQCGVESKISHVALDCLASFDCSP